MLTPGSGGGGCSLLQWGQRQAWSVSPGSQAPLSGWPLGQPRGRGVWVARSCHRAGPPARAALPRSVLRKMISDLPSAPCWHRWSLLCPESCLCGLDGRAWLRQGRLGSRGLRGPVGVPLTRTGASTALPQVPPGFRLHFTVPGAARPPRHLRAAVTFAWGSGLGALAGALSRPSAASPSGFAGPDCRGAGPPLTQAGSRPTGQGRWAPPVPALRRRRLGLSLRTGGPGRQVPGGTAGLLRGWRRLPRPTDPHARRRWSSG